MKYKWDFSSKYTQKGKHGLDEKLGKQLKH